MRIEVSSELEELSNERELGCFSVLTISSAKPGNGVEQLRDDNLDTFWQSDGTFPHLINLQFNRRVVVTKLCLYLNYSVDESYTPKKIVVSIGSCIHDLTDIVSSEMSEPTGWVSFIFNDDEEATELIQGHFLQVKVLSMHQNGKDTHIRQVKVFGLRSQSKTIADLRHDDFKTVEMAQYVTLR